MVLKNKYTFLIGLFFLSMNLFANVTVTTGGNLNLCTGAAYTAIGKITIAEGILTDFSANANVQTYEINAPSNFEFNPGNGSVTASGADITFSALTVTATKITLYYLANAIVTVDKFELTNIQIKAINPSGTQNIVRTGGTAVQAGNTAGDNKEHAKVTSNQTNVSLSLGALSNLCINTGDKTLSGGNPAGGNYTGTGVSGSTFSPATAGAGTYMITYTATQNGCPGTANGIIKVNPKPTVTFFGLDNTYCSNSPDDQLTGFPSGGTFSGSTALSGALFKPSVTSVGLKNITYSYTDANGCTDASTQQTTILQAPTVSIVLEPNNSSYSLNDPGIAIVGTQTDPSAGGTITLSGNGVSNSTGLFVPSAAGVGTHTVIRTLKAPNGCVASAPREVTVSNSNSVFMNGLNESYCIYSAPSNLTSSYANATFSGPGITAGAGSTAVFDPSKVVFSGQEIKINIVVTVNILGFDFPLSQPTTIYKRPVVEIYQDSGSVSPNYRSQFCSKDAAVPLNAYVFPKGGVGIFTGQGVAGNNFNPASGNPPGNWRLIYEYTDLNGCANKDTAYAKINEVTTGIDFGPLEPNYCANSAVVHLTAKLNNIELTTGTFTGVGINGKDFDPSIGVKFNTEVSNDYKITYSYGNALGCVTLVEKTVRINQLPEVNLTNLNAEYCFGNDVVTMTGTPTLGTSSYSVVAVSPAVVKNDFRVLNKLHIKNSTPGTYYVTYTYKNDNTQCTNFDTDTTTIHPLPLVYFTGLKAQYCDKDLASELSPFPPPSSGIGSFISSPQANAIAGANFVPTFAKVNKHFITYKFTDKNGCSNDSTIATVVYGKPTARFSISSLCAGDEIAFRDSSSLLESILNAPSVFNSWKWGVDDKSIMSEKLDTILSAGSHKISYTAITNQGCMDTIVKNVTIGSYPLTSFTWDKICNKEETKFYNTSTIGVGSITHVSWKFSDGKGDTTITLNPPAVKGNVTHTYQNPATYNVILEAKTNYNCIAGDTHKVFILPSITIKPSEPYSNNFNDLVGDWISSADIDTLSSWALGTPDKSIIKSNNPAWVTSLTRLHKPAEISYVNSPCFTLTNISRPMIHMDIWSGTIERVSGANLQYSVDGTTWATLGKQNDSGVNWYNNTNNLPTRPSGAASLDQNGWTGTDSAGWKNVRHVFDNELGVSKNIRFRISFAGSSEAANGFAFDNVWIGDRTRLILAEHYTNNTSTNTKVENASLNTLIHANQINGDPKDIVALQYHTAFPGVDPMYSRNIPDAGARSLYYGVTQVPYSVIDGSYYKGNALGISQKTIDTRSLYDPAFEISLNPVLSSNTVSGDVVIKNKIPVGSNVTVYISVLERYVNNITGSNGEKVFEWVHAKFLPDAAGTSFSANWSGNRTEIIPFSWTFGSSNIYNPEKLAVIAFVQNNVTKEIYQAAYKGLGATVVTGIFDPNESASTVLLYPNPATDLVNVILNGTLAGDYSWCVIDGVGKIIDQGIAADQTDGFVVNTQHYPGGFYTLRLSNQSSGIKTQKFVVVH